MVAFRTRIRRSAVALVLVLLTAFSILTYVGLSTLLAQHIDRELLTLAEQEAARLAQEQKERRLRWQRHQRERSRNLQAGAAVATLILIAYLWTWMLWLNQARMSQ